MATAMAGREEMARSRSWTRSWRGNRGRQPRWRAADMLEIIGAPQSTFVRTVRIACEEKGVAYGLTPAMPHSAAVSAVHPLGKIPVMRCGSVELFESKAIATFVDRAFQGSVRARDNAVRPPGRRHVQLCRHESPAGARQF